MGGRNTILIKKRQLIIVPINVIKQGKMFLPYAIGQHRILINNFAQKKKNSYNIQISSVFVTLIFETVKMTHWNYFLSLILNLSPNDQHVNILTHEKPSCNGTEICKKQRKLMRQTRLDCCVGIEFYFGELQERIVIKTRRFECSIGRGCRCCRG